jgi:hypothetical protein
MKTRRQQHGSARGRLWSAWTERRVQARMLAPLDRGLEFGAKCDQVGERRLVLKSL